MSRKASVSDPKFACLGDYPGAMNCEKASIYDVDTQTEEVGSIPKTCKPNHEPISNNWDCTICKPGFTKNKETGQCEVLYENILGKHCSKFGKDDYTSHGRLSGAACQARCDADSDCLAYASKNNEWCVTYSKCTFRPGTQWGGKFFQHKTRAYEKIFGKHCSKFGNDDYTSHGRLGSAACQAKCDADSNCLAYASKNNEWCVTYSKCTFRPGTQWGGNFFQHKIRYEDFLLKQRAERIKKEMAEKFAKEKAAKEKARREQLARENTKYTQVFGKHCSDFGKNYKSHGKISSAACKAKCNLDDNCIVYASKDNEWCTTYGKCIFKEGTQWGGGFYQKKRKTYEIISGKNCSNFGQDYKSHGKISSVACKAKCDMDDSCIVYASKDNEWCTTYSKCTFKKGTQWGGVSSLLATSKNHLLMNFESDYMPKSTFHC